jgi:hypothetical protein
MLDAGEVAEGEEPDSNTLLVAQRISSGNSEYEWN